MQLATFGCAELPAEHRKAYFDSVRIIFFLLKKERNLRLNSSPNILVHFYIKIRTYTFSGAAAPKGRGIIIIIIIKH